MKPQFNQFEKLFACSARLYDALVNCQDVAKLADSALDFDIALAEFKTVLRFEISLPDLEISKWSDDDESARRMESVAEYFQSTLPYLYSSINDKSCEKWERMIRKVNRLMNQLFFYYKHEDVNCDSDEIEALTEEAIKRFCNN